MMVATIKKPGIIFEIDRGSMKTSSSCREIAISAIFLRESKRANLPSEKIIVFPPIRQNQGIMLGTRDIENLFITELPPLET